MKLLIILTVITCSYADKLDRTYLPPASAQTAGGSPGSLIAPGAGPGLDQPKGPSFGQPSSPSFGQPSGPGFEAGQPEQPGFGQSGPQYNPAGSQTSFGQSGNELGQIGSQYNQGGAPTASGTNFGQGPSGINQSPTFGSQDQGTSDYSGSAQPERARASIDRNAEILRYENNIDGDTYSYSFETSNGISADESGVATNGVRAQGGFSYTGDDGQQYSIRYTADENGYQPYGDHLPTPPPIPEEILKSLEKNAKAAAAGTQEGAYNPNEGSELGSDAEEYVNEPYSGQGQAGQTSPGSQIGQSPPQYNGSGGQQGQGPASQYGVPETIRGSSGAHGISVGQASSIQSNQSPSSLYNAPAGSHTGSRVGTQSYPSQSSQSPALQYDNPAGSSFGSKPVTQGFPSQSSQTPTSQYGAPVGSSAFLRPSAQGSQSPASQYDASGPRPSAQGYPSQALQSPASQYNTPSGPSGSLSPSKSSFPSQGSQFPNSQFGAPSGSGASAGPNQQGFNQDSGYQYNTPGSSPSDSRSFGSQGSRSQQEQFAGSLHDANRPASQGSSPIITSQYGAPSTLNPTGSQGGQSSLNPASQYGAPGAPGSTSHGDNRPGSQTGKPTLSSQYEVPRNSFKPTPFRDGQSNQAPTSQYGAPGTSSYSQSPASQFSAPGGSSGSRVPLQGSQDSGYQYNAPSASPSESVRPGSPSYSSQGSQSPAPQYPASAESPSVPTLAGSQNLPSQGSQTNGVSTGPQGFQPHGSQPTGSQFPGTVSPSSVGTPSQSSQRPASQYGAPAGLTGSSQSQPSFTKRPQFGLGPIESSRIQAGINQRPQFGLTSSHSLAGSAQSRPQGQEAFRDNDNGYEYNKPQTPFGRPLQGQQGLGIPRPVESGFGPGSSSSGRRPSYNNDASLGSPASRFTQGLTPGALGNNYTPSGPSNVVSANEGYPSGPASSIPTNSALGTKPGQYTPSGSSSSPNSLASSRPGSLTGSFSYSPQSGRPFQAQSAMPDSAPYQYNRPGSQRPSTGDSQAPFGSQPSTHGLAQPGYAGQAGTQPSFGSAEQGKPVGTQPSADASKHKRPGQVGSQPGFGPNSLNRPGQPGSQPGFGPSGQNRPTEQFDGPRQPPSFSEVEGYKY